MFEQKINMVVIFSKGMWLSMFQVKSNLDQKWPYTNRAAGSFIAQVELGRLVGSTVSNQPTAFCGNTLGVCEFYFAL
jgi:hypothetical protein